MPRFLAVDTFPHQLFHLLYLCKKTTIQFDIQWIPA